MQFRPNHLLLLLPAVLLPALFLLLNAPPPAPPSGAPPPLAASAPTLPPPNPAALPPAPSPTPALTPANPPVLPATPGSNASATLPSSLPLPPPPTGWPAATILSDTLFPPLGSAAAPDPAVYRRVLILQPRDLPYPVRVEEKLRLETPNPANPPSPPGSPETGWTLLSRREMVANRLLVQLDPAADRSTLASALTPLGAALGDRLGTLDFYYLDFTSLAPDALPGLLSTLQTTPPPGLLLAEPDAIARLRQTFPSDPQFASQYALHNTGQAIGSSTGLADADIDAPEAWSLRFNASTAIVAVIDTGIRFTHQDLATNMWTNPAESLGRPGVDDDGNGVIDDLHGYNAIANSGNPTDDNGHGTHCAGIIGAVGSNGLGVTGVAWNVRLMALKFLSADGSGATGDMIECIDYARRQGAHIISASFGGSGGSAAAQSAIAAAGSAGIIFVAAAGNDGSNNDLFPQYPAGYNLANIVSVASTTNRDALSSFSNFGPNSVDLAAPGSSILSTYHTSNSAYQTLSGTSMATPLVAGALALLKAQFPAESLSLIDRLFAGADPLPALQGRLATGARLNLNNALRNLNPATFPRIQTPLQDLAVRPGETATFTVAATGDNLAYSWTRDGQTLPGQSAATLTLANVSPAAAGLYEVRAANASGEARSSARLTVTGPSPEVAEAVDDPAGEWINSGQVAWIRTTTGAADGFDAAITPTLADNQQAPLQRAVTGPGTVSFSWRVSSERGYDFLRFSVDGTNVASISGQTAWARFSHEIPAGNHTLSWTYDKDFSLAAGEDRAYLDQFSFSGAALVPPAILTPPAAATVVLGQAHTFSVQASGSAPLTFQWLKDASPLPGATAATLTLASVSAASAGDYQVRVANAAGSVLSSVARLSIDASLPPTIVRQPQDVTARTGDSVSFQIEATGTAPLNYQWFLDGNPLSGQTQPLLLLPAVAASDAGAYSVSLTNALGSVTSRPALLRIIDTQIGPVISKHPESQTALAGGNVFFSVHASGGDLAFQWYKDGNPIPGQTRSTLTIFGASLRDSGRFHVRVANPLGEVFSLPATLSVLTSSLQPGDALDAPELTWSSAGGQPWFAQNLRTYDGVSALQSGLIGDGQSSSVATRITGPGELSFAWKVSSEADYDLLTFSANGDLVASASGEKDWEEKIYTVPAGDFDLVWTYAKDAAASSGDDAAWLDQVRFYPPGVATRPRFLTNLSDRSLSEGGNLLLQISPGGTLPITAQWYKNGRPIPGANGFSYRLNGVTLEDSGQYSVVLTNAAGSSPSRTARVTVFSAANPFGQALDTPLSTWTLDGNSLLGARWFPQNATTRDGVDAVQAPNLGSDRFASFAVNFQAPAIVSLWWKTSSEKDYDELDCFVDDTYIDSLSGLTDWQRLLIPVSAAGTRELYLQYVKDSSFSQGLDTAWVDHLQVFPASAGPALLASPPSVLLDFGSTATLSVEAASLSTLTYQWYAGSTGDTSSPLPGATAASFTTPPITRSSRFWVRVSDALGSVDSDTASVLLQGGGVLSYFPSAFLTENDWWFDRWFGLFQAASFPWIFHPQHHWLYAGGPGDQSHWFYDAALGWFFTSPAVYPFCWSATYGDWLYYQPGSSSPRFFYLFSAQTWLNVE